MFQYHVHVGREMRVLNANAKCFNIMLGAFFEISIFGSHTTGRIDRSTTQSVTPYFYSVSSKNKIFKTYRNPQQSTIIIMSKLLLTALLLSYDVFASDATTTPGLLPYLLLAATTASGTDEGSSSSADEPPPHECSSSDEGPSADEPPPHEGSSSDEGSSTDEPPPHEGSSSDEGPSADEPHGISQMEVGTDVFEGIVTFLRGKEQLPWRVASKGFLASTRSIFLRELRSICPGHDVADRSRRDRLMSAHYIFARVYACKGNWNVIAHVLDHYTDSNEAVSGNVTDALCMNRYLGQILVADERPLVCQLAEKNDGHMQKEAIAALLGCLFGRGAVIEARDIPNISSFHIRGAVVKALAQVTENDLCVLARFWRLSGDFYPSTFDFGKLKCRCCGMTNCRCS